MIYSLVLGGILLGFSGGFYVITSRTLYAELDHELLLKARDITESIRTYLDVKGEASQTLQYAAEQTIAHEDKTLRRWWYLGFERSWFKKLDELDLSGAFIHFSALDHTLQVKSKNLDDQLLTAFSRDRQFLQGGPKFWDLDFHALDFAGDCLGLGPGMNSLLSGAEAQQEPAQPCEDFSEETRDVRVLNYPYPFGDVPTHVIQIGISKGPVIHLLKKWMLSVLLMIPVILALTAFIGSLLASRILRPLNGIIRAVGRISYDNLHVRVEPKRYYREFDSLVTTFNSMIGRLEESFAYIRNFSAHVAHELKTPLTIIRGEAELALRGQSGRRGERKEALMIVLEEMDQLLRTIDGLLFLTKVEYAQEAFCFEEMAVQPFLEEITEPFRILASGKNIQFRCQEQEGGLWIRADRLHLRRVFFNLLDNAFKFTPDGGTVTIRTLLRGPMVHIDVSDTGCGIAPENLARVFEQFFREDDKGPLTVSGGGRKGGAPERQKGTGLGLSIAQAIVRTHHGEITVQSRPGSGTTFSVMLPLLRADPASV